MHALTHAEAHSCTRTHMSIMQPSVPVVVVLRKCGGFPVLWKDALMHFWVAKLQPCLYPHTMPVITVKQVGVDGQTNN